MKVVVKLVYVYFVLKHIEIFPDKHTMYSTRDVAQLMTTFLFLHKFDKKLIVKSCNLGHYHAKTFRDLKDRAGFGWSDRCEI